MFKFFSDETSSTTRVLAIGHLDSMKSVNQNHAIAPDETTATVHLHLNGVIDQWFARQDTPGVVFLMNLGSISDARAVLERLPMVEAGLLVFDLIPLGPPHPSSSQES